VLSLLTRRLIRLVVVLVGVSVVTFSILQVSGDPVSLIMPEAPEADRAALRVARTRRSAAGRGSYSRPTAS